MTERATPTVTPSRREDWDWLAADLMAEVRRQEEAGAEDCDAEIGRDGRGAWLLSPYLARLWSLVPIAPADVERRWLAIAAVALRLAMAARKLRPGPHPWPRGGDAAPAVQPNKQG